MNGSTAKLISRASVVLGIPKRSLARAWKNSNARGKAMYRQRWSAEVGAAGSLVKDAKAQKKKGREEAAQEAVDARQAGADALAKMEAIAARNEEEDREQNG